MTTDNATTRRYTHGMDLSRERPSMTETIRQRVQSRGMSYRELARRAGIDIARLSRFMRSRPSMTLPTVEPLCSALDLELRPKDRGRRKKKA